MSTETTLTVNELIALLQKEVEKGRGDLPIIMTGTEWELNIIGEIEYRGKDCRISPDYEYLLNREYLVLY